VPALAPDDDVFERNALGRPSPLRAGDELLAVEGQGVTDWRRRLLRGQVQRPADWPVGAGELLSSTRSDCDWGTHPRGTS
jgi:hypothetical protein